MSAVETVKIKHGDDYAVINKSDFDPKKHELLPDNPADEANLSDKEKAVLNEQAITRRAEANRGISGGSAIGGDGRNPSGTFSEPTPTDIRYPNKDETEFENNHGAFVKKSAAEMREEKGLPDAPGGLAPDALHVGKGPRGKWYVKKGTERTAGPFDTEEEAKAAMAGDNVADEEQSIEQAEDEKPAA